MTFDVAAVRKQFPFLRHDPSIVYLDNASSTQKPQALFDSMNVFMETSYANVHRAMYDLAERATQAYENSRITVQKFINAAEPQEIIFTKNCTEAINIVAHSWVRKNMGPGDRLILTHLEHHSNIIPWMQLKEEKGFSIDWIEVDTDGRLKVEMLDGLLAKGNVKFLSVTGMGNVFGSLPPLDIIIKKAHAAGTLVLVDAAQLAGHHPIDVQKLDADFVAFSGHKIYGPTGIGVLYGKRKILEDMPAFLGGGMMLYEASIDGFTAAEIPHRFEAGTPAIVQAIGLAASLDFLSQYSWEERVAHEHEVRNAAQEALQSVKGIRFMGPPPEITSSILSFVMEGVHPHDLSHLLGNKNICIRAGNHCTRILHKKMNIVATARISLGLYNSVEEVNRLPKALEEIRSLFSL